MLKENQKISHVWRNMNAIFSSLWRITFDPSKVWRIVNVILRYFEGSYMSSSNPSKDHISFLEGLKNYECDHLILPKFEVLHVQSFYNSKDYAQSFKGLNYCIWSLKPSKDCMIKCDPSKDLMIVCDPPNILRIANVILEPVEGLQGLKDRIFNPSNLRRIKFNSLKGWRITRNP